MHVFTAPGQKNNNKKGGKVLLSGSQNFPRPPRGAVSLRFNHRRRYIRLAPRRLLVLCVASMIVNNDVHGWKNYGRITDEP